MLLPHPTIADLAKLPLLFLIRALSLTAKGAKELRKERYGLLKKQEEKQLNYHISIILPIK